MPAPISDFWRLLMESGLLTYEQCQQLNAEFAQIRPAASTPDGQMLADWLVAKNVISAYQSKILLAGRPGPFFYGDYVVYDRADPQRFAGCFRAVHCATRYPVLLQFLTGPILEDDQAWQSFASWIQHDCAVRHPYLQRCFAAIDLGKYRFLVLEELPGVSLSERIAKSPLPVTDACHVIRATALALHELHLHGRVHGDVRPRNIFVDGGPNVKLSRDLTSPPGPFPWNDPNPNRDVLDRANYLAPELAHPGCAPDILTDIYALGGSLYASIAGQPPFPEGDLREKMRRHATQRIASLETFGVSPQLGQIVAYMLAKNPQVRLQDAASVAENLAPMVEPGKFAVPSVSPAHAAFESHLSQYGATLRPQPAVQPIGPTTTPGNSGLAPSNSFPAFDNASRTTAHSSAADVDFSTLSANAVASPESSTFADGSSRQRKRKATRLQNAGIVFGVAALLVIAVLAASSYFDGTDNPTAVATSDVRDDRSSAATQDDVDAEPVDNPVRSANADPTPARSDSSQVSSLQVVPDDGATLWASPTHGAPIDLSFSPPGAQFFLAFRPADTLSSPHGSQSLKALGPRFEGMVRSWQDASGVKLGEISRMVIALHDNNGNAPRPSFVVRLKEPLAETVLLSRWGNPSPEGPADAAIYSARGWSFYIPKDHPGVFLMGASADVGEVAKNPRAKPLLRREMERLLRVSDEDRHVTILLAPNYLHSDAQKLFTGDLEKLLAPLQSFLGDDLHAALASVHFGEPFYLEMRLQGTLDLEKSKLASDLRERLSQLPDQIEEYIARLVPHPYWRRLALRFPPMVRFVHQQCRIGAEDEHAVINAALPGVAAPNLLAASELTLISESGAAYVADASPKESQVKTIDELLDYKISIRFPQLSLDFAMRDVATEVRDATPNLDIPFDIKIMGKDLEMNGITQNQQIRDFEASDQSIREVLTAMVMKANPITTVKTPNEADQKLIWVIGPDPNDASKNIILITTRDAAAAKGYALPDEFK